MRVTLSGDWTNASPIGATVNIRSVSLAVAGATREGSILEGQDIAIPFTVKPGTAKLDALLEWREDWGSYPANDLDMILVSPTGVANFNGAGFGSPERASVASPAAGKWTAIVSGFALPSTKSERYTLRLAADGVVIK